MEPEDLLGEFPESLTLCRHVQEVVAELGPSSVRTTRSHVAFRRRTGFAYVWRPGQYVASEVPLVLSIPLPRAVSSPRFKEVVHPSPRVWMHHLELHDAAEVDDEVRGWLGEAYAQAG